ncbi:MAG: hypothetical protein WCQ49_00050 [Candidatus Saccharibacteria bacterium]
MSAESLSDQKKGANSNIPTTEHLLYGNVLHEDPLGVTNRRIAILGDEIASAQMFGSDVSSKQQELQGEIDMRDYLMSRDYKDDYGHIHDAETNRFKSLDNLNRREENLGRTYVDMTIDELINKWAESEDNKDKTASSDIQDELQERLLKIPTIAEENTDRDNHGVTEKHKMNFIDVMYREMMSRRKNIDSNETDKPQTTQDISNNLLDDEIDTTTPGAEGHRNEPYVNESDVTKPETNVQPAIDLMDDEIDTTTPGAEGHRNEMYENQMDIAEPEVKPTGEPEPVPPVPPVAPIEQTPTGTTVVDDAQKSPLKLVLNADTSKTAMKRADDMAEARLQRELEKGGKFKHFIDAIWKSGLAKDHYIRKYRVEAQRYISEHGGDSSDPSSPVELRAQARESIISQFQQDFEEAIHTNAGEKKDILDPNHELAIGAKDLIRSYCRGEFRTDDDLTEARTKLLEDYRISHPDEDIGAGIASVDNMLEIAKTVSGMVEHGESIDNVIDNMQIIMGESRGDVRSEANFNKVDKLIDKLARTKIGSVVMPLAIVSAVSVTASILRFGGLNGGRSVAKSGASLAFGAAGGLAVGAAISGTLAAVQENRRMKEDRNNQMRDEANSNEYQRSDKRRSELHDTVYESVSAKEATQELNDLANEEKLAAGGIDAINSAIDALVKIELRNQYSDSKNINLLRFSNNESVVTERLDLDKARSNAKAAISKYLSDDMRRELGVGSEAINNIVESRSGEYREILDADISKKDALFKSIKNRHVAKAAAIGVATSLVFGIAAQEIGAAIDPTRAGLLEQAWGAKNVPVDGELHKTLLGEIFSAEHNSVHTGPGAGLNSESFAGGKDLLSVSDDSNILNHGNGTFDIIDHNGNVSADNIPINSDGSLPQSSIDQLKSLGMGVIDKSYDVATKTTVPGTIGVNQFINNNLKNTIKATCNFFYDNNTKESNLNELGQWWGGNHGISANGGYQFDISHMSETGSFHGGESVNWKDLASAGNLKLLVAASKGTASQVFEFNIGSDGQAIIPPDSPAAQLFSNNNGNAIFHGYTARIAEMFNKESNGNNIVRSLATVLGNHDIEDIPVDKVIETVDTIPVLEIITPGYDTIVPDFVEAPPVIPVVPRQNLGSAKAKYETEPTPDYYGYNGESLTPEEIEQRKKETSPRLRDNPDADLVPGEELNFYENLLVGQKGQEYVDEIKDVVSSTPELAKIDNNTKIIVTIPINAAGDSEANNVYNLLTKAYGGQDQETLRSTTILLHVNWLDTYNLDKQPNAPANIEKTKAEVQRAKNDMAALGINIAVVQTEYKASEISGGVIGYVARKMNDVALLALNVASSSGRISKDHDVLIIRNDADIKGIRQHYLKRYQEAFESNEKSDVFMGTTSFDQLKADRAPGLVLTGNFMRSFDIITRSREGNIHTDGGNFGVRASMLAAVGSIGFGGYTGAASDDVEVGRRIRAARDGKLSLGGANNQYVPLGNSNNGGSSRKVGTLVHGARMDTDSDRNEVEYIKADSSNVQQWSKGKFDKDGYEPRNSGLGSFKESLVSQPEKVIENIRSDFEATINNMHASKAVVRTALGFVFPKSEYYQLDGNIPNAKLTITKEGAKYLRNSMISRLSKGRITKSYGKKKREWYGEGDRQTSMIRVS